MTGFNHSIGLCSGILSLRRNMEKDSVSRPFGATSGETVLLSRSFRFHGPFFPPSFVLVIPCVSNPKRTCWYSSKKRRTFFIDGTRSYIVYWRGSKGYENESALLLNAHRDFPGTSALHKRPAAPGFLVARPLRRLDGSVEWLPAIRYWRAYGSK